MRRLLSLCALSALALPPAFAVEDPKSQEPARPAADQDRSDKFVSLGTLTGVVQNTGGSAGGLTLRVSIPYLEANPQAQRNFLVQQQQLLIQQQQAMMTPNPVQRQQRMVQILRTAQGLMQAEANLFQIKTVEKDVELELADEVKVRSSRPTEVFDDKGRVKRYTARELRELKGNDKLPGYAADLADLQPGQTVMVKLARRQTPKPPETTENPKPSASRSRRRPEPAASPEKPLVTVILIVSNPAAN
jgi:hypothetical protein